LIKSTAPESSLGPEMQKSYYLNVFIAKKQDRKKIDVQTKSSRKIRYRLQRTLVALSESSFQCVASQNAYYPKEHI